MNAKASNDVHPADPLVVIDLLDKWFGEWAASADPEAFTNFGRLLQAAQAEFPQYN